MLDAHLCVAWFTVQRRLVVVPARILQEFFSPEDFKSKSISLVLLLAGDVCWTLMLGANSSKI